MRSVAITGLLAEPERLRTFAAIVLGASQPEEIASRAGLEVGTVHNAVRRLQTGGLVSTGPDGFRAETAVFKDAVRADRPSLEDRVPLHEDPRRNAVLRSFIKDGRIAVMPTVPAKLRIVLEYVAEAFEPGRDYPEAEVNDLLHGWFEDHAMLRRYLVDQGEMKRADGIYRRA